MADTSDRELLEIIAAQVGKLTEEMAEIKKTVINIEQDHGAKLKALFDGQKQANDRIDRVDKTLDDHTKRLERIENKLETHDIQIQVLDKTHSK